MSDLSLVGLGVLLAWAGLPLLWLTARGETEPASRHRQLVVVLVCGAALLVMPFAWSLRPGLGGVTAVMLEEFVETAPAVEVAQQPINPLELVALLWAAGVTLALVRAVRGLLELRAALRSATLVREDDHVRVLKAARAWQVDAPRVLESPLVSVPCAAGLWRPTILLPRGLRERLDDDAFDCVVSHELVHLGRADQGWATLVAALRLLFVGHPVAAILAQELSIAREQAVDALVARKDPHTYARALLEVATQASFGPGFPEAVHMSATALSRRVRMLTTSPKLRSARLWPVVMVTLALGGVAIAASPSEPPAVDATQQTVDLTVGGQKALEFKDLQRVAIGDSAVADVKTASAGKLILKGLKKGHTTLIVWTASGQRQVITVEVH